jgi:arylsulfatase A-like enzyme
MPAIFNRAGYDTMRTCKMGNSFNEANQLFAVSKIASKRGGADETGSKWHGDQVMEYLAEREARRDADPFLIYFGFSHPHDPREATPELAAKYGADNRGPGELPNSNAPPLQVNYLPAHPFHHGHPGLRDEEQVQGVLKRRDEATIRNELGREYACIENIDVQVGRVLGKLEAMGELDNTYVIFTADHGIAVGRHGLTGKQNLYEHTWRVPFVVRGPGIKAASTASGYIYLLDVLPTLCDLAGIEIPDVVDGKSFRPVLEGHVDRVRDVLYGVYCGGTKPGMRSIKTADGWKLIKYDVLDGQVRETQLFNLQENPQEFLVEHHSPQVAKLLARTPTLEQIDLAEIEQHAAKRQELEQLLKLEMQRLGDPYTLQD